jgi:hypothetical protein
MLRDDGLPDHDRAVVMITAKPIEPIAKSRAAGYKFWKPGPMAEGVMESYPFWVTVISKNTQYKTPESFALCRVRALVYCTKKDAVFGGKYKVRIEVLLVDPTSGECMRILHSVETVKSYLTIASARAAASKAGRTARDQMDRMGVAPGQVEGDR